MGAIYRREIGAYFTSSIAYIFLAVFWVFSGWFFYLYCLYMDSSSLADVFSGKVDLAAKTGTARENANRPNHATFIGFAPYTDPGIAIGVTIPHGYTSGNAAELGGYVADYYYGYLTDEDVFGAGAKDAGGNAVTD